MGGAGCEAAVRMQKTIAFGTQGCMGNKLRVKERRTKMPPKRGPSSRMDARDTD